MYLIYKITNKINNKMYIGQTTQLLERRWSAHCTKNIKKSAIGCAIKKYGRENFNIEIVETCASIEEINLKEAHYISTLNTLAPNGYNLVTGGKNKKVSEETRFKLSESHKGYIISEETKSKISKSLKGKKKPDGFGDKISSGRIGIKHHLYGKTGKDSKKSKPVICLNDGLKYESVTEAGKYYNINNSSICRVLLGKRYSIKKLFFEYCNDEEANEAARQFRKMRDL